MVKRNPVSKDALIKRRPPRGIPVLLAFEEEGYPNTWVVWCHDCRKFHRHGAMEGHRVAHCANVRDHGGYWLRWAGRDVKDPVIKVFKK